MQTSAGRGRWLPPRWRSRISWPGPHKMKRPIEVLSGDHMNKADSRRQHRAGMDRSRQHGSHHRRPELVSRARRPKHRAAEQQGDPGVRVFVVRPDRQVLFAESGPLDLRYLCAFDGDDAGGCRGRRQDLVHADRRLCVRPRDGGGSQERRSETGRHSRRRGPHANQQPGLFVVPACRPRHRNRRSSH